METQTLDNYSKAGADAHGIELTNGHLVTSFSISFLLLRKTGSRVTSSNSTIELSDRLLSAIFWRFLCGVVSCVLLGFLWKTGGRTRCFCGEFVVLCMVIVVI
jgi:hypothetical protein